MNNDRIVSSDKFSSGPPPHQQRGNKEVFLVTHDIFEMDKYCFPGESNEKFFAISEWPEEITSIFEEVWKITVNNDVRLLRGEVREDENLTYLFMESDSEKDLVKFFEECDEKIKELGHKYNFDTLRIIPDSCKECSDTLIGRDMMRELDSMKKIVS